MVSGAHAAGQKAAARRGGYPAAMHVPPDLTPRGPIEQMRCLKVDRGRAVWRIQRARGEAARTIKLWRLGPLSLGKFALGILQPQRQLRGARRLAEAGIRTPQPFGSWRFEWRPPWLVMIIEIAFIEGVSGLEFLTAPAVRAEIRRRAAAEAGMLVARVAGAGLLHRDLTLANLVVELAPDGPRVWAIDPVGVRPERDRVAATERMLERLDVIPDWASLPVPPDARRALMHAALDGLTREQRRETIRRLRAHRQR
jgi:hypothetical protein